jgi:nitrile hydratase beta subunit-like protein
VTYAVGQVVRVSERRHLGHHRTPGYVKGARGVVERVHGRFTNPETRAYGDEGTPLLRLYLVGIELGSVSSDYLGSPNDRLLLDVFEHWLEPVE